MGKASKALIRLFGRRGFLQPSELFIRRVRDEFRQVYETREIPLLDLVDPLNPIGRLLKSDLSERLSPSWRFERALTDLMRKQNVSETGLLRLTDETLAALTNSFGPDEPCEFEDNSCFTAVAELLENERSSLRYIFGQRGAGSLARYASFDKDVRQGVKKQLALEAKTQPAFDVAALAHAPDLETGLAVYHLTDLFDVTVAVSRSARRNETNGSALGRIYVCAFVTVNSKSFQTDQKNLYGL